MPNSEARCSVSGKLIPSWEIFRRNVAIEMRKQSLTQASLAKKMFVDGSDVSKLMRGKIRASAEMAGRVAYALGVSVEAMYVPPAPGAYEGLFGTSPEYDSA